MRRKDREVTDRSAQQALLSQAQVCRVAMMDGEFPYIVPMNFGFSWEENLPVVYLHCANVGKKLELLAKNPHVCLEWDGEHRLEASLEDASECTYRYSSLIGQGIAERIEDLDEKMAVLTVLCKQYGHTNPVFPREVAQRTGVLKITLQNLTAKVNNG